MAEGCETVVYGANTALTIIDPNAQGYAPRTTATRVLFATIGGHVLPTSTAYAVVEGAAAARPTAGAAVGGAVMAGVVAGVAMVL